MDLALELLGGPFGVTTKLDGGPEGAQGEINQDSMRGQQCGRLSPSQDGEDPLIIAVLAAARTLLVCNFTVNTRPRQTWMDLFSSSSSMELTCPPYRLNATTLPTVVYPGERALCSAVLHQPYTHTL